MTESPWGTQPGKFELRPIPNGVRTIRRRTTLRWDAHGQLMLPIAEKRTVQVQTSGGAGPDEDFERIYRTQLQRARARGRRPSIEDPLDDLYDPKMAQREFMLEALESDDDLTPTKVMKYWEQRKALYLPNKKPVRWRQQRKCCHVQQLLCTAVPR